LKINKKKQNITTYGTKVNQMLFRT